MSLSAKNSRTITVDGSTYRWAVSPDSGYDVLVIQDAAGTGAKLLTTIDYTGVNYASAYDNGVLAITPALVTSIIRQAKEQGSQQGWKPHEIGPDIRCRLRHDESIEVHSID